MFGYQPFRWPTNEERAKRQRTAEAEYESRLSLVLHFAPVRDAAAGAPCTLEEAIVLRGHRGGAASSSEFCEWSEGMARPATLCEWMSGEWIDTYLRLGALFAALGGATVADGPAGGVPVARFLTDSRATEGQWKVLARSLAELATVRKPVACTRSVGSAEEWLAFHVWRAAGRGDAAATERLLALAAARGGEDAVHAALAWRESKTKVTALCVAAMRGAVDVIRVLARAGADVALQDTHDQTALHAAIRAHQDDAARVLVEEFHAPLDITDTLGRRTPLEAAACAGSLDMVRCLLAAGADEWDTSRGGFCSVLTQTVNNIDAASRAAMLRFWLDRGHDAHHVVSRKKRQWLIHHAPKDAALMRLLCEYGADPNARTKMNGSPLMSAVRQRAWECVEALVLHGARPDLKVVHNRDDIETRCRTPAEAWLMPTPRAFGMGAPAATPPPTPADVAAKAALLSARTMMRAHLAFVCERDHAHCSSTRGLEVFVEDPDDEWAWDARYDWW